MHQRFAGNRAFKYDTESTADGTRITVYGQRGEEMQAFNWLRASGVITDEEWKRRNDPGSRLSIRFVPEDERSTE